MWWIFLAMFFIFGGLGAVMVAMMYMNGRRKTIENMPEETVRAEVIMSGSKNQRKYPIHDPYKLGASVQSIVFYTDKNQYIQLNVTKKVYDKLLPGFYGELTYKANNLIQFKRLKGHEELRQLQREEERLSKVNPKGNILFYCEALFLGITVPTSDPEPYRLDAVLDYIDRLEEKPSEQFFGLDNGVYVIQFSSSTMDDIILDIPDPIKNGSYQAMISSFDEVRRLVRAYYNNEDVRDIIELEFMSF